MITFDHLRDELTKEFEIGQSWVRIAERFPKPITRAHVFRIVKDGWEPERNDIREALGLTPLYLVEGCPICHATHTHKHGEQTYDPATSALYNPAAQVVRPMPKPRKPSKPKIAIRKDDVRSAARTILKHYNKEAVAELAALLKEK